MSRNYEAATIPVLSPRSSPNPPPPQTAARIYPVLSLISVILLFLSAGAGIALSAVVLFRNFESIEVLDPLSRAVFFVASCMSLAYVLTHIIAARTAYIKNNGSPKAYGKYVAGLAFLLARLGLPVWVAAVTLAIIVAVNIGLDVSKGIQENLPWLNVIISVASLLSLIAMLAVIEMAERPFATIGLSQSWFVRGDHPFTAPDEEDIDYGLVEVVSMVKDVKLPPTAKQIKARKMLSTIQEKKEKKPEKRKRKTLTKKNPYEAQLQRQRQQQEQEQHRTLRHARSMSMPTPLNAVFGDSPEPRLPDSPGLHTAFAWKPPTREGTPRAAGAVIFEDLGAWRDRVSLYQTASDISTSASAPSDDVILPSMPRQAHYSPRSQALLLDQQQKYDLRRWTAIGMQSPPFDSRFLDVPFKRPPTPLMTMEDEHRMLGRRPSTRDGDWEANYHLRMHQNSRPSSSHTSRTGRSSMTSRTGFTIRDEPPSLPPIATVSSLVIASTMNEVKKTNTNSIRPDSDVLPNEGRRRRRLSNVSDKRRQTYRTDSRSLSQTYRPSSRYVSTISQETRPTSPTMTIRSARSGRSDVHNFSRPRTSAAARMQSKVAKRLRAMKNQQQQQQQQLVLSVTRRSVGGETSSSPSTPGTPNTPRTVRAAAVKTLQERLGRRNQQQLPTDGEQRLPSPQTPRTARATAVRTLQERLGKRMMRRNEAEAAQLQHV
ncbi:unnamed protein product [Colletotrichum noveboracense]|uniref:Uncharacterized protein n=1 Tax=Colletotrichum noveboracense TaxID=2664923 RepID=A0A9W4RH74_9PEZI|nr:unnamed protein product [Colletotrichum noveboracense]